MQEWKPPFPDDHWMEWLVSMIQDQETWGTSHARYRLDKTNKIAYLIAKDIARPAHLTERNCQRIAQAFGAIGWRVRDDVDAVHQSPVQRDGWNL